MNWPLLFEVFVKPVVLPAIVSGIITYFFNQRREVRWNKLRTLQQLLANRYDLTSDAFSQAINQLFIVFYDSKDVMRKLKEFHTLIRRAGKNDEKNVKFVELAKALCEDLGVSTKIVGDEFFLVPFNAKLRSQLKQS